MSRACGVCAWAARVDMSSAAAPWPPASALSAALSSSPPPSGKRRAGEDEDSRQRGGRGHGGGDHEDAPRGPEQAPGIAPLGERRDDLLPARFGQLEEGRGLEHVPARLEPTHLVRARAAGDEVLADVPARVRVELLLHEGEQRDLVRMLLGHHSLDSVRSAAVPRSSASSVRPRKMRDFTVPSGTPVISAISA